MYVNVLPTDFLHAHALVASVKAPRSRSVASYRPCYLSTRTTLLLTIPAAR